MNLAVNPTALIMRAQRLPRLLRLLGSAESRVPPSTYNVSPRKEALLEPQKGGGNCRTHQHQGGQGSHFPDSCFPFDKL